MMATTIRMPEVLAGVTEAAIATWLVAPATVGSASRWPRSRPRRPR